MQHTEVTDQLARSAPPVAVAVTALMDNLNAAVAVATLIYVVLQAGFLVYKWWRVHTGRDKA